MGLAPGTQIMTLSLMMKYLKKRRTRSKLKYYQSGKSIRNYMGKYKSSRQKKRKGFYRKKENILANSKITLTNSMSVLYRTSSLNSTTQIIVATQTFDDNQTPSISWFLG